MVFAAMGDGAILLGRRKKRLSETVVEEMEACSGAAGLEMEHLGYHVVRLTWKSRFFQKYTPWECSRPAP